MKVIRAGGLERAFSEGRGGAPRERRGEDGGPAVLRGAGGGDRWSGVLIGGWGGGWVAGSGGRPRTSTRARSRGARTSARGAGGWGEGGTGSAATTSSSTAGWLSRAAACSRATNAQRLRADQAGDEIAKQIQLMTHIHDAEHLDATTTSRPGSSMCRTSRELPLDRRAPVHGEPPCQGTRVGGERSTSRASSARCSCSAARATTSRRPRRCSPRPTRQHPGRRCREARELGRAPRPLHGLGGAARAVAADPGRRLRPFASERGHRRREVEGAQPDEAQAPAHPCPVSSRVRVSALPSPGTRRSEDERET